LHDLERKSEDQKIIKSLKIKVRLKNQRFLQIPKEFGRSTLQSLFNKSDLFLWGRIFQIECELFLMVSSVLIYFSSRRTTGIFPYYGCKIKMKSKVLEFRRFKRSLKGV